jgi:hypothetical protein
MAWFATRTACPCPKDTCKPVLKPQQSRVSPLDCFLTYFKFVQNITGHQGWYIGCASWHWSTRRTEQHYFRILHDKYHLEHLQSLFSNGLPVDPDLSDTCGVVLPTKTQLRNCGTVFSSYHVQNTLLTRCKDVDHPQGHGKLSRAYCNVEFSILIPVDLVKNPFYLFTSHRTHHHPPPPPNKLPEVLTQEIVDLIRRTNDPNITVGKLF